MGMATLNWNFALNVIFDSEYSEKDFVDTPIPHSDFQDLGEKRIGNTIGLTVSRFFSLPENFPDLYLGGGFYSGRVSRIVKSNATGWLWSQDKKSKLDLAGEAGVVLGRQRSEKFFFGLGLNTFQGLNFNLFIKF